MKKKIFLITLMVALFVCLFVISASAANMFESDYTSDVTIFYDTDGTTVLAPDFATNVSDTKSTAVLKKADGTYVRVPTYYILAESSQFDVKGSKFNFSWIAEKLGETELTVANVVAIEIPEGTTSIVNGAFSGTNLPALEELVIPTTVTSLGQSMFRNNNVLRKVFVKQTRDADGNVQGVTTLPGWFADITNGTVSALESFDFELDYVTSIGNQAFQNSAIKSFTITAPMTSLGSSVFDGCKSLETVYINNTSGAIVGPVNTLFQNCTNIKNVTINGISIGSYFLQKANGLTSGGLTLTATNVGSISKEAFKAATNLSTVDISGPITSIDSSIFLSCTNLENVKIISTNPTPATGGNNMCDGLKNLKSVELHGISIGSYAFRNIDGTDMTVKCTNVGSIGSEAFKAAANITELYISGPFTSVGSSTYRECPKLTKLTVINTGDTLVSAGNGESNPVLTDLRLEGKFEIGSPVFQNNISLKNVYIGTGVQTIGAKAFFQCYALETAYLADTITSIADSAFDMNGSGKQTSTSFMFVDENGNMDNTLPTSLTSTGGHFLKGFTFANTQFIYPECYTSAANSAYDFESAVWPEGFNIVYLGKMTTINYHQLYQHHYSKNIAIYLTNNSASELSGERINVNIAQDGSMSHGTYAGSTTGTLQIVINDQLHNNIVPTSHVKFVFCGSNEVVFVTRVNIPRETGGSNSWGNFVSMPVTYEQLQTAYNVYNTANPDAQVELPAKHPVLTAPEFSPADCTNDGGTRVFCAGCGSLVSFEKTEDALGHNYDIMNATAIVYTDYTKDGVYTTVCLRCEHDVEETVEGSHLFEYMGISASTKGTGLCAGYLLNNDYIEAYAKLNPSFEYGVVATVITGTNKSPLADDYTGKVITTALNSYTDIMAVDVIVSGNYTNVTPDDVSAYETYSLAMSLYVKDDGISYIWDTTEDDAGTHSEVTTTTIYIEKVTA